MNTEFYIDQIILRGKNQLNIIDSIFTYSQSKKTKLYRTKLDCRADRALEQGGQWGFTT